MFEKFDKDARRRVVTLAAEEAKRRGDKRIGTDHLLIALLHDRGSLGSRTLGTDVSSARAASDELDRAALSAVGIEMETLSSSPPIQARGRPPFTSGARAVLQRSVDEARTAKSRLIHERHLLLGILGCERPDPAAELLVALGVDPSKVRARLRGATN